MGPRKGPEYPASTDALERPRSRPTMTLRLPRRRATVRCRPRGHRLGGPRREAGRAQPSATESLCWRPSRTWMCPTNLLASCRRRPTTIPLAIVFVDTTDHDSGHVRPSVVAADGSRLKPACDHADGLRPESESTLKTNAAAGWSGLERSCVTSTTTTRTIREGPVPGPSRRVQMPQ